MLKSKIQSEYEKHAGERICQGDILRDFEFEVIEKSTDQSRSYKRILLQYGVIVSQDCDLKYGQQPSKPTASGSILHHQYLPTLLLLPAFPSDFVKSGQHLKDLFSIEQSPISKSKGDWETLLQQKDERYHYIAPNADFQVPSLIVDFKLYFGVYKDYVLSKYKQCYLVTINELYRELLSQRFSNYLSRIGLPDPPESKASVPTPAPPPPDISPAMTPQS